METRPALREVANALVRIDAERARLIARRDELIAQAWREELTLEAIASDAKLSRGRISQLMDPRPRGRPRRKQEEPTP